MTPVEQKKSQGLESGLDNFGAGPILCIWLIVLCSSEFTVSPDSISDERYHLSFSHVSIYSDSIPKELIVMRKRVCF